MCGWVYTCHSTGVEVKGQLVGIVFFLYHVSSRVQTQAVKFGIKYLLPTSHLTNFLVLD